MRKFDALSSFLDFELSILSLMDDVLLSKLYVSPLVSLMKPVDVNPNDEWVNVSKYSHVQY